MIPFGGTQSSMCAKVLHSAASFFLPVDVSSESASILQVDRQVQTELDQAAEKGMVSTRNHDNAPANAASQSSKALYPQVVVYENKRKIEDENEESPAQAASKRRRKSAKPNIDATPSSGTRKPGRPRTNTPAKTISGETPLTTNHDESDQEPSTPSGRRTSLQTSRKMTGIFSGEDKPVEEATENHTNRPRNGALDTQDQLRLDAEEPTRSARGGISKKMMKRLKRDVYAGEKGAGGGLTGDQPEMSLPTTTKATHKRFGSEDVEVPTILPATDIGELTGIREDLSEDESENGDDAPEIVTASSGFDKARTLALEVAKVAARQKADKRLKRREHDQRLRMQAKSAKDSRSNVPPSTENQGTKVSVAEVSEGYSEMPVEGFKSSNEFPKSTRDQDGQSPAKLEVSGEARLPLMLPDELLATRPVEQNRNPPFTNSKLATGQKRKLLNLESKPPKDVKRDNLTFCVLPDNPTNLPPESSLASKSLRESWLMGQRGFKGGIEVPRRRRSTGFVRKQ